MAVYLEADIAHRVAGLCRWIGDNDVANIDPDMSLTRDLGFDSMKLMQFFAGIEDMYPGIALEDWFVEHSSGGRDTVRSVVHHLARALGPIIAE